MIPMAHLDDVPWHEVPVPRRWHRCWAQTAGFIGGTWVYRCACGAIAVGDTAHWHERNRRTRPPGRIAWRALALLTAVVGAGCLLLLAVNLAHRHWLAAGVDGLCAAVNGWNLTRYRRFWR